MEDKEKKLQPPFQKEREGISSAEEREGWKVDELADEASQIDEDEIQRQTLRGDETKGNPDNRDHAGSVESDDTPQGREETKNDTPDKANANG